MEGQNNKAPSLLLLATEGGRAVLDMGSLLLGRKLLGELPEGDGHPILVLPGFMTTDASTLFLRKFLNKLGYKALKWNQGRNYGDVSYVFNTIDYVEEIVEKYEEKVSIIGWSLGGVYAREIARRKPSFVNQVITLGSPFAGLQKKNNAAWFYELISGKKVKEIDREFIKDLKVPPPVPCTAVYSKWDGVVNWQHCTEVCDESSHNVEVYGSHSGLGFNLAVYILIADRLAQHPDNWQSFTPRENHRFLFPQNQF